MQQLQQQVLDVFANVTGFGQRGGIANGERNLQIPSEGARQQCLAATSRADQQDVRLIDFDVVLGVFVQHQPLVVIVDRNGEHLFGVLLSDDVFVQMPDDLPRR